MGQIRTLDPLGPDPAIIAEAAAVLSRGGIVAFPTETVYGLGASTADERALSRVFSIKKRPLGHPLIAHVEGEASARGLAREWPELAERLARAFWPGPLTLVVRRASHVSPLVTGGGDTVAVRAPDSRVALALIRALGHAIAAPSANLHQRLSPTIARHVTSQLGDAVDLVLDAGPCATGIESTVVDVRGGSARVLRPGAISVLALREVVPDVEAAIERVPGTDTRASPGMDPRHYAPRAKLVLVESLADAHRAAGELARDAVGVVAYEETSAWSWPDRATVRVLENDPLRYASRLYATLHELDEAGVRAILVVRVPADESWWAIADRLQRGAVG
jgi:L-threonylcarbamoyladenylate synthase